MSSLTRRVLIPSSRTRRRLSSATASSRTNGVPQQKPQYWPISSCVIYGPAGITVTSTSSFPRRRMMPQVAHRSFGTSSGVTTTDELVQQNDLVQQYSKQGDLLEAETILKSMQLQPDGTDVSYPDAEAYSAVLYGWLESVNHEHDGDDVIYHSVDRATETFMEWKESALSSNGLLAAPTTKDYNAILQAWTKIPHLRGVPQRAQRILELMENENPLRVSTTIESYNYVLYTWGHSREHMRGTMAQHQFEKIAHERGTKLGAVRANGDSYRIMIYVWVHSGESKAAFCATGRLMKLLRLLEHSNDENTDLQPTMDEYYQIFDAWTTARDKHAAEKSFNVLRLMEYAYIHRFSDLRADIRIFRAILKAFSRSDASPDLGPLVDQIFEKIEDRNMVPDTECFSFAIQTYTNCALHKNFLDDPEPLAKRALELLNEMIRAILKTETVQVSIENFNTVLKAYTATTSPESSVVALELLDRLEKPTSAIRPNAATYALVLTILAKSRQVKQKVANSTEVVRRANQEYERGNEAAKPDIFLYNAFIRACAASATGSTEQKEQTYRLALQTLIRDIRGNNVDPDSETFLWLLEASYSLIPSGPLQTKAMEQIFTICCQSGLVDRVLLKRFHILAPNDLFTSLVWEASESDYDGTRFVPLSWTSNVTTKGLIVDRKTAPALDVDGNFFLTSKMKDRRMTTLRHRRTQKLLRGGRLSKQKLASLKNDSTKINAG